MKKIITVISLLLISICFSYENEINSNHINDTLHSSNNSNMLDMSIPIDQLRDVPEVAPVLETITLIDGQTLTGTVVKEDSVAIHLELTSSNVIVLQKKMVEQREVTVKVKRNKNGRLPHNTQF